MKWILAMDVEIDQCLPLAILRKCQEVYFLVAQSCRFLSVFEFSCISGRFL